MMKRNGLLLFLAAMILAFVMVMSGCSAEEDVSSQPSEPSETGEEASVTEFPGFTDIEEAAKSINWAEYFPAQYATWTATEELQTTTYGGSLDDNGELQDYLVLYPFLKTAYAGFPFSIDYNRSRGHMHALDSVKETGRIPDWDVRKASCLSCKGTDVVVGIAKYGDDFYGMSFAEVVGENTIGCLDCHDQNDASLKVQRDYLTEAIAHGGFKNIDPEGRADLVCAQCHVNYHFDADNFKITYPWSTGLTVEAQLEHYSAAKRSDEWEHAITGALIAKIQHPEYELYHEGKEVNIHSRMGLGCTDCHMPTKTDENGNEYTTHTKQSPLLHVEDSCMSCHSNMTADEIIAMAENVQKGVYEKQNRIGYDLEAFINEVGAKIESGSLSGAALEEIQAIHREAQFYWDFIWVENSNGFHNWEEGHRVLDNADALVQKGMDLIK